MFRMAHASEFVYRDFPDAPQALPPTEGPRDIVLAGGCFWCTEAVFRQIDGVSSVVSGYAGGEAATANYEAVCSGRTGHAEAIRITYDPAKVSYGMLLKVFFATAHDPTQLNRQGNDVGTQYRSAIFHASEEERAAAAAYIALLDAAKVFPAGIATTLEPLKTFYVAEAYHQDYAARNPFQPYITAVSAPKVAKTRKLFAERLKTVAAK
jgi:peptide-methionine (S)-S-oxide reductase